MTWEGGDAAIRIHLCYVDKLIDFVVLKMVYPKCTEWGMHLMTIISSIMMRLWGRGGGNAPHAMRGHLHLLL